MAPLCVWIQWEKRKEGVDENSICVDIMGQERRRFGAGRVLPFYSVFPAGNRHAIIQERHWLLAELAPNDSKQHAGKARLRGSAPVTTLIPALIVVLIVGAATRAGLQLQALQVPRPGCLA
jgi:hypothetical protein